MEHKHIAYLIYGIIVAAFLFVGAIVIFFLGYQLAIYQTANNDTWFPHFNITGNQGDCGAYGSDYSSSSDCCPEADCAIADKPVIYLYPTHTENIHVTLNFPAGFSATVPSYNKQSGWNVTAQPNGRLTDTADGKTYPYLYWEGNPQPFSFDMNDGFVVAGGQTTAFLDKELAAIGLNQTEKAGFISYWAPKLEANKYTLIHFAGSEYTNVAKLSIAPSPDSLLRVFMVEKPLEQPVKVTPQSFPVFHRTGFTAVEWGGTVLAP